MGFPYNVYAALCFRIRIPDTYPHQLNGRQGLESSSRQGFSILRIHIGLGQSRRHPPVLRRRTNTVSTVPHPEPAHISTGVDVSPSSANLFTSLVWLKRQIRVTGRARCHSCPRASRPRPTKPTRPVVLGKAFSRPARTSCADKPRVAGVKRFGVFEAQHAETKLVADSGTYRFRAPG